MKKNLFPVMTSINKSQSEGKRRIHFEANARFS